MRARALEIWLEKEEDNEKTWLSSWEPRTKTIVSLAFIVGCVSLNSLLLVSGALATVFVAAVAAQFSIKTILGKLKWVIPFLALMILTLSLGDSLNFSSERLYFGLLVAAKAFTSIVVMILLIGSQPIQEYLVGLANLGLPPVLVATTFLAVRYLFLFGEEVEGTQKALAARGFAPKSNMRTFKALGQVGGGLLLKSLDRSQAVYQAMSARGFQGKMPTSEPKPITGGDMCKSGAVLLLTLLLVLAQWRWPI